LLTILLNLVYSNKSNDSQYVFDFGFDKKADSGREISIDVFKSTKNDAILSAIGDPQIQKRENLTFRHIALGFYMEILILSMVNKELIKERIYEIHYIELDTKQIIGLF
jgi:hypothetical protein